MPIKRASEIYAFGYLCGASQIAWRQTGEGSQESPAAQTLRNGEADVSV